MPAQSFGGGAASGGGTAPACAPAAGASSGGGAAPPRQQRVRARRGQATDPHSIAERVRHSPATFPFSPSFLMPSRHLCSCASSSIILGLNVSAMFLFQFAQFLLQILI
jgi:hypothetical protein